MDDEELRSLHSAYLIFCHKADPGLPPRYPEFEDFKTWLLALPEPHRTATVNRYRKGFELSVEDGAMEMSRHRRD